MKIEVKELCLSRDCEGGKEFPLVDRLSFVVPQGETLVLWGPSGCGKTSVALSILRLLPPGLRQVGGEILIDGKPFNMEWRGRLIGLISQEPRLAFHPSFSIAFHFSERLKKMGMSQSEIVAQSLHWLERVGIENPKERRFDLASSFSGGELQRILIALVLCQRPSFIIADEATSNLDVLVQGKILALLKSLQDELGLGILLITHDKRVAQAMSDKRVLMNVLNRKQKA